MTTATVGVLYGRWFGMPPDKIAEDVREVARPQRPTMGSDISDGNDYSQETSYTDFA